MRAICAAALLLSGCAYVGEPLPPALNIPEAVTDLRVSQRTDKIYVDFTLPATTTEGLPIDRRGPVEIRVGPYQGAFDAAAWEASAQVVTDRVLPAAPWAGQEIAVQVRSAGRSGRFSPWSNVVGMTVTAPLAAPRGLQAESTADGVRVTWTGAAPSYRILKNGEEAATVNGPEYLDPIMRFGAPVRYVVVAVAEKSESEPSAEIEITPVDRFPPPPPSGLVALAGVTAVELAWDASAAIDFAEYRVYRDGERIASGTATTLSDKNVQSGRAYRYAVSAADKNGNESERSAAVEIVFP
jgi:chitodextrinase